MNRLIVTTIAALALPLAALPAAAQQPPATSQPAQPGAGQAADQINRAAKLTPDQIVQLQQSLNEHGFDAGAVDGKIGSQTSDAIRRFQAKMGLQQTGQIDTQTLAQLGLSGQAPEGEPITEGKGVDAQQPANPSPTPDKGSKSRSD
jgi:peptidoglycan hydrolase-like protein with peptidoglycan-binding domain